MYVDRVCDKMLFQDKLYVVFVDKVSREGVSSPGRRCRLIGWVIGCIDIRCVDVGCVDKVCRMGCHLAVGADFGRMHVGEGGRQACEDPTRPHVHPQSSGFLRGQTGDAADAAQRRAKGEHGG